MQERVVLLLVIVLVAATTVAAVSVNLLRPRDPESWRAFDVAVTWTGMPTVGQRVDINTSVRQVISDLRSLWSSPRSVFLSVDVGSLQVSSATPTVNPWNCPTVWNITGLDLSAVRTFTVTALATQAGSITVHAMVWIPLGDLHSVSVDPTGNVNPSGITLLGLDSTSFNVTAPG